jgi:hypothetical protein
VTYVDSIEQTSCRCLCAQINPVARIHTPERVEACLVEGRFGVGDFTVAAAELDRIFLRRGEAWIDEVVIDGRPWLRAVMWFQPPDRISVETTSREAYEQVADVIMALPTMVRKRTKREHDDELRDHYRGYRSQRLHRGDALVARPSPGPAEAIEELRAQHERRWLQRPHPLLGGATPEEALKDEDRLFELYDLLELAQVRGRARVGLPPGTDMNLLRAALDIGRRW